MRVARTAKVEEILVEYDGPQLLLLKSDQGHRMFAVSVSNASMTAPFFSCEVADRIYDKFFALTADLHFVLSNPFGKRHYLFDLSAANGDKVSLRAASQADVENENYWPEVGIFASTNTNRVNIVQSQGSTRKYKIDGRWQADDFSHFHGKMAELYALFGVIERSRGSTDENGYISQIIQDRFWRRGGSYVGFYGSLESRNRRLNFPRLEVARIKYASPGEIDLRGDNKALSAITNVIDVMTEKKDNLDRLYKQIYSAIKRDGLLSAPPSKKFSSQAISRLAHVNSSKLATELNIDAADELFDICNQNTLVFSKVVLSIYRRAKELYAFHAEGRVQPL